MWAAPVGYASPPIMVVYGERTSDGDDADTVVFVHGRSVDIWEPGRWRFKVWNVVIINKMQCVM